MAKPENMEPDQSPGKELNLIFPVGWKTDQDRFYAIVPAFPEIMIEGDSARFVLDEAKFALLNFLQRLQAEDGSFLLPEILPISKLSDMEAYKNVNWMTLPLTEKDFESIKTNLRLNISRGVLKSMVQTADARGISVEQLAESILENHFSGVKHEQ